MTDVAIVDLAGSCVGTCAAHPPSPPIPMVGKIVGQGNPVTAFGVEVARDGYIVQGDCGHTGTLTAGSAKVKAKGKKVAMVGDSFSGDFTGTVVAGKPSCQVV